MERRRRIPGPDGEPINVTEIGFRDHGERWNEYLLDDGTVIRYCDTLETSSIARISLGWTF